MKIMAGNPDPEAFPGPDLDPEAIPIVAQVGQDQGRGPNRGQSRGLGQNLGKGLTLLTFQGDEDRLLFWKNGGLRGDNH